MNIEIFYYDGIRVGPDDCWKGAPPGYYWWSCSPGCLPDGDPNGPFDSAEEAQEDAQI